MLTPLPFALTVTRASPHLAVLFQAVDNQKDVVLPKNVSTIMDRWILQMGFPVVTVDTKTGNISQEHFLLDPESKPARPSPFK